MLERDLEARLRSMVKKAGGVIYKIDAKSNKGAPDRIVVLPGRQATFVELKTETGKLAALQQHEIEKIRAAGGDVRVLYGLDAIKGFIDA